MTAIAFLAGWTLRSSALTLVGALLLWMLRVKNPSKRLMAWAAVLAGSLAMPLLTTALPKLPLEILRVTSRPSVTAPAAMNRAPEVQLAAAPAIPELNAASVPATSHPDRSFGWARFVLVLYVLVAVALLLRLFVGLVVSLRMLRHSRLTGIAATGAEVRQSNRVASPVTIGVLRPVILLPLDWEGWDPPKLAAVLAHEGSHIRRRDPALQVLSAIHRALLWASPASWFLHGQIVRTAEEISDDDAVVTTRDRVSYAEILLEFIQRGVGDQNWAGVPMARYERPEKRIRRILSSTAVPGGVTRWGTAAILTLAAPLAYLAAATDPRSAPPAPVPVQLALAPTLVGAPASTTAPNPVARPDPSNDPAPRAATEAESSRQSAPPQDSDATTALPEFEVVSIRPVDLSNPKVSHLMGVRVYPGGRLVISGSNLATMIGAAFGVPFWQLSGGEAWTRDLTIYDLEAKPPEAMAAKIKDLRYTNFEIEDPHLREMLQALLMDRFQLKFHRETRTGEVYLLEQSGKTLRLRPTETGSISSDPPADHSFGSIGYAGGQWNISATSMPQLAKFASNFILHAPVLDRTELDGSFDYRQRQPDLEPNYSGDQTDSFAHYLAELGLKLERGRGPVETFVIDHAAKPSPN